MSDAPSSPARKQLPYLPKIEEVSSKGPGTASTVSCEFSALGSSIMSLLAFEESSTRGEVRVVGGF